MKPEEIKRAGAMRRLASRGEARKLREQRCYTLRELAALVGTNASTLSRWENGLAVPRTSGAIRWADALGIEAEYAR